MWQKFSEHWPYWLLAVFAVASGQVGRIGQKLEKGEALTSKQIFIELSMMPAFGALTGAVAAEYNLPIWTILAIGISAGWAGLVTFRVLALCVGRVLRVLAKDVLSAGNDR